MKNGCGTVDEKIVTQLRHEEFQCPAPSSENGPPLPDLGAFKAGLLSTASVLVTANDGAPPRTDRGRRNVILSDWEYMAVTSYY